MSEIIGYIISYVIAYLLALAITLLVAWLMFRKTEKHISNKMSTFRESRAARLQSLKEVHAQVDEIDESVDRIIESTRAIRDYSNLEIKRIEARENFREPEFSDEKNIH